MAGATFTLLEPLVRDYFTDVLARKQLATSRHSDFESRHGSTNHRRLPSEAAFGSFPGLGHIARGVLSDPDSGPLQSAGFFRVAPPGLYKSDKLEVVVQCGRLNLKRDQKRLFKCLRRLRPVLSTICRNYRLPRTVSGSRSRYETFQQHAKRPKVTTGCCDLRFGWQASGQNCRDPESGPLQG